MLDAVDIIDAFIGHRLKGRRKELKLSQSFLASLLGISYQQVQKYEKGRGRLSSRSLFILAQALDVPVGYFFEGVETKLHDAISKHECDDGGRFIADSKLMDRYYSIPDPRVRKKILSMAELLTER